MLSDEVTVNASDVPDQIAIPTVTIVGTNVQVSWIAPFSNYEPLLKYEVNLLTAAGS